MRLAIIVFALAVSGIPTRMGSRNIETSNASSGRVRVEDNSPSSKITKPNDCRKMKNCVKVFRKGSSSKTPFSPVFLGHDLISELQNIPGWSSTNGGHVPLSQNPQAISNPSFTSQYSTLPGRPFGPQPTTSSITATDLNFDDNLNSAIPNLVSSQQVDPYSALFPLTDDVIAAYLRAVGLPHVPVGSLNFVNFDYDSRRKIYDTIRTRTPLSYPMVFVQESNSNYAHDSSPATLYQTEDSSTRSSQVTDDDNSSNSPPFPEDLQITGNDLVSDDWLTPLFDFSPSDRF